MRNDHGMCLGVLSGKKKKSEEEGAQIIQANCDPSKKGQNWKFEMDQGLQRLCNSWNYCLFNEKIGKNGLIQHYHRVSGDKRQEWIKSKNSSSVINQGFCLAVEKDLNVHGKAIITTDCNPKEKGQGWNLGPA